MTEARQFLACGAIGSPLAFLVWILSAAEGRATDLAGPSCTQVQLVPSGQAVTNVPHETIGATTQGAVVLRILHSFSTERGYPQARLLQGADGKLYGTASDTFEGQGSVFVLAPDGTGGFTFTTFHSFATSDGSDPVAGLIQATDGNFYGTTALGGASGPWGTVFRIDASGNLTTLHSFSGANGDGANPVGMLQATDGNFYGTTQHGGDTSVSEIGYGTVFKMDASGNVTTLHSFSFVDGAEPSGGLLQAADGNFYGTTGGGGTNNIGTVFKIDASGGLSTLHSFSYNEGTGSAGLIQAADGNFYGTTSEAGVNGLGAVFKMDASGNLTTLHSFSAANGDGAGPVGGLIQAIDGNFYGTTQTGGDRSVSEQGYGTVFKMDASGHLTTLYAFAGSDGAYPEAGLIQAADGNFYGTTSEGGPGQGGVVFRLSTRRVSVIRPPVFGRPPED
jgi:uncharacterized repeat protein (TIGR03803 family)